MRTTIIPLLLILVAASFVPAIDPNPQGDLSITVFVSPDDRFIEEWMTTPAEHGPTIQRITEARANQPVFAGFAATGSTPNDDGMTVLIFDVQVLSPNGQLLFKEKAFARYVGKPQKAGFVMADNALEMMIESTDPMGKYTIQAVVHDKATGKSAGGETALTITP